MAKLLSVVVADCWATPLVGKVGGVFVSTASQHGGMGTTLFSVLTLADASRDDHCGPAYAYAGLVKMDEVTGGTPYGASTIAAADGSRQPSENELAGGRFQGRHIAEVAAVLLRCKS